MEKQCLKCGKKIKVKPSQFERKKFCSHQCKYDYYRGNMQLNAHLRKKTEVRCNMCSKGMEFLQSELHGQLLSGISAILGRK